MLRLVSAARTDSGSRVRAPERLGHPAGRGEGQSSPTHPPAERLCFVSSSTAQAVGADSRGGPRSLHDGPRMFVLSVENVVRAWSRFTVCISIQLAGPPSDP